MSVPRLCIIGNSHVACIKLALDDRPELAPAIDFFAASANRISRLGLAKGHLLRTGNARILKQMRAVSAGRGQIDLREYDAFALVGVGFEYRDFVRAFRTHCLHRHRDWQSGRDLIGDAAFRAFLADLYVYRPAYRLAREIAGVRPEAPWLIVAAPFPVETVFDDPAFAALGALRGSPYFRGIAALYRSCAEAAAASGGAAVSFQRPETLAAPGFTAPRYNSRPVGLGRAVDPEDAAWFRGEDRARPLAHERGVRPAAARRHRRAFRPRRPRGGRRRGLTAPGPSIANSRCTAGDVIHGGPFTKVASGLTGRGLSLYITDQPDGLSAHCAQACAAPRARRRSRGRRLISVTPP